MPEYYEVKIKGRLDPAWSQWFAGLKVTPLEGNETLLSGSLPDQLALYGLLERVRDLNIPLVSVVCDSASEKQPGGAASRPTDTGNGQEGATDVRA